MVEAGPRWTAIRLLAGALEQLDFASKNGWTGPRQVRRNNCSMLRQLETKVADLAESLLVAELEMRRSRTLDQKLQAYLEFGRLVDRVDLLRRDLEELAHSGRNDKLLAPIDRKIASIMRSPVYRTIEWFHLYENVRWYVTQATIDPARQQTQC